MKRNLSRLDNIQQESYELGTLFLFIFVMVCILFFWGRTWMYFKQQN